MTFYSQLRDQYPLMRQQLDEIQRVYELNQAEYKRLKALTPDERVPNANEELYYRMRELFNHPDDTYLDGVLYFFINKTAYSGMIRYNNNGDYNVPFGRYPNLNTRLVTQNIASFCKVQNYLILIIVVFLIWHKKMILSF